MALDSKKAIVPNQIILNGDANDVFLQIVNPNGTKVLEVFGNGRVSFFGKSGVAQAAAAGNEVAGETYDATEAAMLQKCYDVLKSIGLIA